ncbi:MAG: hypothetical protein HDT39_04780 [Lachnospiraceae bacterium]|nr:hypothetical protein [Lachnospiraceae bacterium]
MLKKEFTYTDYDGNTQTETAYFNMTKAEIAAMQVKMDGKYIDHIKALVAGEHVEQLFNIFRELVLDSYGKKSEDGRRFVKNPDLRADFEASIPFSDMLIDLLSSPDKMSAFTKSILPPDMVTNGGEVNALPGITVN